MIHIADTGVPGFFLELTSGHGWWSGHGELRNTQTVHPCPFCASVNIVVQNSHTPHYTAECEDCGAEGPPGTIRYTKNDLRSKPKAIATHKRSLGMAIDLWNIRR